MMEEKKAFHLIHTLPSAHFGRVRLPGAANACVYEVTFPAQVKAITEDKDAELVLYGSSPKSMDAYTAAEKLERDGYRNISVLSGGIEAWRSAGCPVEGEAIDEPDDPQTMLKLENGVYRVDTNQSVIQWTGRNAGTTHFGNIRISSGDITMKDGSVAGEFEVDMNSITNINLEGSDLQPVLIDHLKSDDFFFTKLFPTARFRILSARPSAEPFLTAPNFDVEGALVIRGFEARQDFSATVAATPENGLSAEAHFDIDRTRWKIIYGSARFFEHLGIHVVYELISIQVRIFANR